MRLLSSLTTVAAAFVLAVAAATPASAAVGPTPAYPDGVVAPHSPAGVPSNGIGPIMTSKVDAQVRAGVVPGLAPQGVNNFRCVPWPGERPVVLIPGTSEDAFATWSWMAPQLARTGTCVYTFNYNPSLGPAGAVQEGSMFSGDIRTSAAFLGTFVDRVLASTGATQVDLVGHSQGGGILPRTYLKFYGGASKVHQLVGIVPNNQGTTANGLAQVLRDADAKTNGFLSDYATEHNMQALPQQLVGSQLLTSLNEGGMTVPGVRYTNIATAKDTVITPYTNAFMTGENVTNTTIQEACPAKTNSHDEMLYDVAVYMLVYNALYPDFAVTPINCTIAPRAY